MHIDHILFKQLGLEPAMLIFPGHPIAIAFCILKAFPNYAVAVKKDSHNCPMAVSSSQIPGAGGSCYSALDFLTALHRGTSLKAAFEDADATWDRIDNHKDKGGIYATDDASRERFYVRWKDGQAQADLIKPLFEGQESWWGS